MRFLWPVLLPVALVAGGCVDLSRPSGLVTVLDARPPPPDAGPDAPAEADAPPPPEDGPESGDADDTPDVDPPPALPAGARCDRADQCGSGVCAQGVCCQQACDRPCYACNLDGAPGTCTPVPAGQDPGASCAQEPLTTCGLDGTCDGAGACRRYPDHTECRPGRCAGGMEYAATFCDGTGAPCPDQTAPRACTSGTCSGDSCAAPCAADGGCQSGFYCNAGRCAAKLGAGLACTRTGQCSSGFCADGVCCNSACTETCFACNLSGSMGLCKPVGSGQDPRNSCPAQAPETCGRAGGCNGSGACRLQPTTTVCVAGSCSGSTETPARTCDGLGTCRAASAPRDCAPYLCSASACAGSCADSSGCAPGFSCSPNTCARSAGLVLLWRFEETSGTIARDNSGSGFDGTYIGDVGTPAASTNLPPLSYANTRSRQFSGANRQAVQVPMTGALRLINDFTLAAWYRATQVDSMSGTPTGAEIISGGNVYILRLRPDNVEFSKDPGLGVLQCKAFVSGFLDGNWHHVAAVASRTGGMRVYFDGQQQCFLDDTQDADLNEAPASPSLFVGRHGEGETQWDFSGHIDEVRIYDRPLSSSEIATLAAGRNL